MPWHGTRESTKHVVEVKVERAWELWTGNYEDTMMIRALMHLWVWHLRTKNA